MTRSSTLNIVVNHRLISWGATFRFCQMCWLLVLIVAEDELCYNISTEISRQNRSVTAAQMLQSVPTIRIERSESTTSIPSYEPEKLQRVDKPPLRMPRVAVSNMLLIQQDNTVTFGSPSTTRRQRAVVGRTLSADSCYRSRNQLTCDIRSPVPSSRSSQAFSADKRSRTSSYSGHIQGSRSTNSDYTDDFDEFSDGDEGYFLLCIIWNSVACLSIHLWELEWLPYLYFGL